MRRREFIQSGMITVLTSLSAVAQRSATQEAPPAAGRGLRDRVAHPKSSDALYLPVEGETHLENGLWDECPRERQFVKGGKAVIADIQGPGVITMIHFALGAVALSINRDTILRIYWDGEATPSVECPLPDFFCDPNGAIERIDSLLINKLRGWNAYFEMPFAKSARIELTYDNPRYANATFSPGHWGGVPAYSSVTYRKLESLPASAEYFHAQWRKQTLLLGKDDYEVVQASGAGQLIGWNVTLRSLSGEIPPCDQNEVIQVDGSATPSVEWQGMEDSFGFSWNFPPDANQFPYAGYNPFLGGYAAYRFFLSDRVPFRKSLRMAIVGKGQTAVGSTAPGSELEFTSVAYWYQREPHRPFEAMLSAGDREPFAAALSPDRLAADRKHLEAGEAMVLNCGGSSEIEFLKPGWGTEHGYITHPPYRILCSYMTPEVEFAKQGWDFRLDEGQPLNDSIARVEGWPSGSWRSIGGLLQFRLLCPQHASGTLKLFLLDGDKAGRRQSVTVAERLVGKYSNFENGTWIEATISAADTVKSVIPVTIRRTAGPDAALSKIIFVEAQATGRGLGELPQTGSG